MRLVLFWKINFMGNPSIAILVEMFVTAAF